jgi:hypothetical protein
MPDVVHAHTPHSFVAASACVRDGVALAHAMPPST